jgi:hypothetical protein
VAGGSKNEMIEKKPRKKAVPKIKSGESPCAIVDCESGAETSPPGIFCTKCRLIAAEKTRVSYNAWKESRGLPVETKEEELARIARSA